MTTAARTAPRTRLCRSRSSGKATATAATAAMTAAMTRNVIMIYKSLGADGGPIIQRHARPMPHDAKDDDAAQQQHDERSAPDEQGFSFERRTEAHELAIAAGHEI